MSEAAEGLDDPLRELVDHRHGPGSGTRDEEEAKIARRRDVTGARWHADPTDDAPRGQIDRHELRGLLGGDERDRCSTRLPRRRSPGAQREQEWRDDQGAAPTPCQSSAQTATEPDFEVHAPDTGVRGSEVPLPFRCGRARSGRQLLIGAGVVFCGKCDARMATSRQVVCEVERVILA